MFYVFPAPPLSSKSLVGHVPDEVDGNDDEGDEGHADPNHGEHPVVDLCAPCWNVVALIRHYQSSAQLDVAKSV